MSSKIVNPQASAGTFVSHSLIVCLTLAHSLLTDVIPEFCRKSIYVFLKRNGFSRRRITSKRSINSPGAEELDAIKRHFVARVAATCAHGNVPTDLVVNFDQTGVVLFNSSAYTYEKRNTKRVLGAAASINRIGIGAISGTHEARQLAKRSHR